MSSSVSTSNSSEMASRSTACDLAAGGGGARRPPSGSSMSRPCWTTRRSPQVRKLLPRTIQVVPGLRLTWRVLAAFPAWRAACVHRARQGARRPQPLQGKVRVARCRSWKSPSTSEGGRGWPRGFEAGAMAATLQSPASVMAAMSPPARPRPAARPPRRRPEGALAQVAAHHQAGGGAHPRAPRRRPPAMGALRAAATAQQQLDACNGCPASKVPSGQHVEGGEQKSSSRLGNAAGGRPR